MNKIIYYIKVIFIYRENNNVYKNIYDIFLCRLTKIFNVIILNFILLDVIIMYVVNLWEL